MASGGARKGEAARTLRSWLEGFRRRSLALTLLRLCFVAVAVNEVVRWSALGLNVAYRLRLPILSPGFPLLVLLFAAQLRRWSLSAAARRADLALSFRDRFVSFVDFAARMDVPAPFREAQAEEAAAALGKRGPRNPPAFRWYLAFGPVLLLASTVYPIFLAGGPRRAAERISFRHPPGGPADTGHGEPGRPDTLGGSPEAGVPGAAPSPEKPKQDEQRAAVPEPNVDPALPALPGGSRTAVKEGDPARVPTKAKPPSEGSALKSFQIGQNISRVVDPRAAQSVGSARRGSAPGGAMAFRLFPANDTRGRSAAPAAPAGAPEQAVVDVGAVPERYRSMVERYFSLLSAGT